MKPHGDEPILDIETDVLHVDDYEIAFAITPEIAAELEHLDGARVRLVIVEVSE